MALGPGTTLGVYEIIAQVGAGGMGHVYRARDTRLQRDVAVKTLPDAFASDPDRLARFTREALTLAALNHPHIAQIHGFEESGGLRALVMEFVDGEELSDRIARGPIPLDEALPIARQIADALEAAHELGIVHRDLKPANVKIRDDGTVKVLDFGLATGPDRARATAVDPGQSPTITSPALTATGVVLGTAAYMSPEQARGRVADRRSDVWAFGAVLFEMLSGTRLFSAEDVAGTLAIVLTTEPDWTRLPTDTPPAVRRLLRRCLEKDRKRRLPDIGVARQEIDEWLASPASLRAVPGSEAPAGWQSWPAMVGIVVVAAALGGAAVWAWTRTRSETPSPVSRLSMVLDEPLSISVNDRDLAVAPDGRRIFYTAGPRSQLMVRALDALDAQPLSDIVNARAPFVSPDSRWVGFFDSLDEGLGGGTIREGQLRKVSVSGGPPMVVGRVYGGSRGATWAADDTIIFATNDTRTGLLRVPAAGGETEVLTTPDATRGERDHHFPSMLPGGRGLLFTIVEGPSSFHVAAYDFRTRSYRVIVRDGSQAEYVHSGHVLYVASGTLWAVPFDAEALEVRGEPIAVALRVRSAITSNFSTSQSGTLVYAPQGAARATERTLVWVSRDGTVTPTGAPPRYYDYPRLSPDGRRAVVRLRDPDPGLWIWEVAGGSFRRLTSPDMTSPAVWSADGRSVFFAGRKGEATQSYLSALYRIAADGRGQPENLSKMDTFQLPATATPDGRLLIYQQQATPESDYDTMMLWLDGSRAPEPLLHTPADERSAQLSPDGLWLAYESNESRRSQIYVRPFPKVGEQQYQISTDGGRTPLWAPNGRELYFVNGQNVMAVPFNAAIGAPTAPPSLLFSNRSVLLDARAFTTGAHRTFDIAPDGRFLMMVPVGPSEPSVTPTLVVVENFTAELARAAQ